MLRITIFLLAFLTVFAATSIVCYQNWDAIEPIAYAFALSVLLVWSRLPKSFTVKMADGSTKMLKYCVGQLDKERDQKSVCASNGIFVKLGKDGGWEQLPPRQPRKSDELAAIEALTEMLQKQQEEIAELKNAIDTLLNG